MCMFIDCLKIPFAAKYKLQKRLTLGDGRKMHIYIYFFPHRQTSIESRMIETHRKLT